MHSLSMVRAWLFDVTMRVLACPQSVLLAAALGMFLTLPSIDNGWVLDDIHHRLALLGQGHLTYGNGRGVTELFNFAVGDASNARTLLERGLIPWWTDELLRVAFFRPLTVLTHQLDYSFWPDSARLMHLHNLLCYAAAIIVAGSFFLRILGPGAAAGLATLMFAVDEAHGFMVSWLAARNALLALVFGGLTILAHDRWRRTRSARAAVLPILFLVMALLSGEAGIGAVAYIAAYAIFLEQNTLRERLRSLIPAVTVVAIWACGTKWAGYGASRSDFYIDPIGEPLRFATAVVERVPVLMAGQWSPLPAALATLVPESRSLLLILGIGICVGIVLLTLPLLRQDRVARFLGAGMLFAAIPVCATYPHDRNLLFVGIGAFGLLSRLVFQFRQLPMRAVWAASSAIAILLFVHLVIAPMRLWQESSLARTLSPQLLLRMPERANLEGRSIVVVNGPMNFAAQHLAVERAVQGLSVPRYTRALFPSFAAMRIRRTDKRTLVLSADMGWLAVPLDVLNRSAKNGFRLGDRVELPDVSIQVDELTTDGRPRVISCRFQTALEHESLNFVYWHDGHYQPWTPPPVGQQVDLEAPRLTM